MTTIIVTHENNETDEHDFASEIKTITIGRRSTNDVCIPNLSVSGSHARISISGSGTMIEDLSSTNGTYINGRLISRQLLNDGDDIVLGKVRLTFLQPESAGAVDSDEFEEELPMTLAEKARLHRDIDRQPQPAIAPKSPLDNDDFQDSEQPTSHNASSSSRFDDELDFDSAGADDGATVLLSPTRKKAEISEQPAATPKPAQVAPAPVPAIVDDQVQSAETDDIDSEEEAFVAESVAAVSTSTAVIEIRNGAKSGQVLPIDKPVTTLGRPGIQIAAIMKKPEGYFLMHIESDENVEPPQLNNHSIGDEPVLLNSGDALNVAGIDVQFMQS